MIMDAANELLKFAANIFQTILKYQSLLFLHLSFAHWFFFIFFLFILANCESQSAAIKSFPLRN